MTAETTALDLAHAAMEEAPEDGAARLHFYHRLADSELLLLLDEDPRGTSIRPAIFTLEAGRFVMAFDRDDRLAAFCDAPAPYAALPGRVIAAELAGRGLGLGLNLGVGPSAILLPAEALDWLAGTLSQGPAPDEARPIAFAPPDGLAAGLMHALATAIAAFGGLAQRAHLALARYADGRSGHLLAIEAARPGAEAALARAVNEALVFSGADAGSLDVTFVAPGDAALMAMAGVAMVLDLPVPEAAPRPEAPAPAAPGMDPARPPRLR